MSTYTAGLLKVNTLDATGASAVLAANTANVTTLTATTVNAQTLNVPSQNTQFLPQNRSQVVMAGKDYENTNYQTATDGSGKLLPFFNTRALGQGPNNMTQLNLPQFGAFSVTNPLGLKAMQQTFQGVCDTNFVYFIWEIGQYNPDYWTGTFLATWLTLLGNAGDWPITTALIVKLNRLNGQVVSAVPIGLMMDNAYLAAGSTKTAQELAIGPGPYDPSQIKDGSGFYITTAVTGNDKSAPGYVGFQTVVDSNNIASWVGCGDDNCRGPIHLYYDTVLGENVMYITSMSQKYASVYKVRCSDLTLVWRRTVDSMYDVYTANPAATQANRCMRQVMVIPPRPGRSYPVVVTGTTDNWAYSTIDFTDTIKLFNYFKSGGTLQAWADYGLTAGTNGDNNTNVPLWQTLMGPTPLDTSGALPISVFRWAPPGAELLTVNGVTEQQDLSGFIKDEDNHVSVSVYEPLVNGYYFTDGLPNSPLASGCKTTGVFNLLTGTYWPSFTSNFYAIAANVDTDIPLRSYEYEFAKFDFTNDPSGTKMVIDSSTQAFTVGYYNLYVAPQLVGAASGYFDSSAVYCGVPQNGPWANSNVPSVIYVPGTGQVPNPFYPHGIPVLGQTILNGVPDASGRYFTDPGNRQYQPVTKKIYKAQVGRPITETEASELNTYGGGIYLNLAYDIDTDVIIAPTGQFVHTGTEIDTIASKQILADVSANGIFYPGVNTAYQVRDNLGASIYNSYQKYYIDVSGLMFTPYPSGSMYIDINGAITSYSGLYVNQNVYINVDGNYVNLVNQKLYISTPGNELTFDSSASALNYVYNTYYINSTTQQPYIDTDSNVNYVENSGIFLNLATNSVGTPTNNLPSSTIYWNAVTPFEGPSSIADLAGRTLTSFGRGVVLDDLTGILYNHITWFNSDFTQPFYQFQYTDGVNLYFSLYIPLYTNRTPYTLGSQSDYKLYNPTPAQILGLEYNALRQPQSEPVISDTFNGVGNGYFKGISYDTSGFPIFVANHSYAKDFYQQNYSTDYNKGALQNYYFNPWVDLRCQADSSGLPLTSYSLSPQVWIPGGNSSGEVNDYRQSVFINSRQRAYWDKVIALRDRQHFGPRYNRQGACGVTGVKVSNGELMFSANFHGYDISDHSYSEFDVNGGHVPLGIFKTGGYNADGCSATIIKMTDLSGFGIVDPVTKQIIKNRKILACTTKSRFIMLDYDKLVDSSGKSLTLKNTPDGSGDIFYKDGCQTNTWDDSLIYEDRFGLASLICAFNGYGTDGTNFLFNVVSQNINIAGNANNVNCNVPGKEVHGLDMDPMCNFSSMDGFPGYWMAPLGIYNTALGYFSMPPGVPTGGATDAQLYAIMSAAISNYNNNALPTDTSNATALATMLQAGVTQYWGNVDAANFISINGSYNAQGSCKTNCYNLQTILDNNWRGFDSSNTPETVLKYQFMSSDGFNSRTNNQGTQIYGNLVFSGNSNGLVEVYDINTGYPVNQANPAPGQFVPNARSSTVGVYNPEGQRIIPLIADGVMYGYGGNNKWNNSPPDTALNRYATKIFMWTPYGK